VSDVENELAEGMKVSRDVSGAEFERWVKAMRMTQKLDPARMDGEEQSQLQNFKRTLVDAIERGDLVVNEDGTLALTVPEGKHRGTTIHWPKPTMEVMTAIDGHRETDNAKRMLFVISKMTGKSVTFIRELDLPEGQVCQAVGNLFLAS
jgi:hypothetical protein